MTGRPTHTVVGRGPTSISAAPSLGELCSVLPCCTALRLQVPLLLQMLDLHSRMKALPAAPSFWALCLPKSLALQMSFQHLTSWSTWTDRVDSPFNLANLLLPPHLSCLARARLCALLLYGEVKCCVGTGCTPGYTRMELGVTSSLGLCLPLHSFVNVANSSCYSLIKLDSSQEKSLYLNSSSTRWCCCPTQRQQPGLGLVRASRACGSTFLWLGIDYGSSHLSPY